MPKYCLNLLILLSSEKFFQLSPLPLKLEEFAHYFSRNFLSSLIGGRDFAGLSRSNNELNSKIFPALLLLMPVIIFFGLIGSVDYKI